ncbi:MAG: hypothetical protein Q8O26_02870 [Phreatobacter sp.]|uniref:hypothetical protein n=1 Tax=Phreatobacter sp. TaxID=1966341 RepID=UPI002736202B|nr:hypothetical protein [Phreatobacter sp.]MDP2800803.1 hypothetical protein [Phreatobacter sp.]
MSEAPIPTNGGAPAGPSADSLGAMQELARRGNAPGITHDQRIRLAEAVNREIETGGSGWDALGGRGADDARQRQAQSALDGEATAKRMDPNANDAPPAGQTPPAEYTALRSDVFADQAERDAFGQVASAAGLDARLVQSAVQGITQDKRITDALKAGDAAVDRHLVEVRELFHRMPGGRDNLKLGVAYLEYLADKSPALDASFNVAIMSADTILMAASEAKRLGFRPGR